MKHEEKSCGRCKTLFECKVGDIANCQCSEVKISTATQTFIAETAYDCLCKQCLAALDVLITKAQTRKLPTQKELMLEGLHFYKEHTQVVFTEFYHIQRGNCCQNNCRHCAYGFRKID